MDAAARTPDRKQQRKVATVAGAKRAERRQKQPSEADTTARPVATGTAKRELDRHTAVPHKVSRGRRSQASPTQP